MIKVIRNDADHEAALAALDELMMIDPPVGSDEADRLEVLALLVEEYETQIWPEDLPSPVDAIRFRMEQGELSQRDLVPYLGSRSRVSEVLSGKRTLTLNMIRALNEGLGIPVKVLIQHEPQPLLIEGFDWRRFPLKEMVLRRWLPADAIGSREGAAAALRNFLAPLGPRLATLYRTTRHVRSARTTDQYALLAWTTRVVMRAQAAKPTGDYEPGSVTIDFMRELARLSWADTGPRLAQEFLGRHGISLVVEPHLPRTHLDGAAILIDPRHPVVGLSLRYDRLDNFWFVLMHELAHISLHSESEVKEFFDDLDSADSNLAEAEADDLAGAALIPAIAWRESPASRLRTAGAAKHLAKQLGIHPSIVAGRMRHAFKSYRILNQLVGHGAVRKCFPEVEWAQ